MLAGVESTKRHAAEQAFQITVLFPIKAHLTLIKAHLTLIKSHLTLIFSGTSHTNQGKSRSTRTSF